VKFLDIFSENIQISNFMEIRPVVAELFCANWGSGGPPDTIKLFEM